ncbi:hypothetical protein PsYK624_053070 [Phanerochaete sordida]|uniref:Uncharacterized protein n=1 Tax=Phanerochaete sordida TaxID=48140 RepID=A0A9P3G4W0_9APHY|nr:hypothetical protein PsYK624_053070 [Phanerochaete sordida]
MSKMDARRYGAFETVTNMLQRSKLFLQAITLVDIIIQHADFRSESSSRPRIRLVIPAWKHVRCIDRHAISQVPDLPYLSPKLGLEVNAASGFTLYICGVRGEATGCWIEPAAGWKQIAAICPSSDSGSEYGEDDGDDSETAMTNEDSSSDSWPRDRDERYMGRIDRLYIPTVDSREGSVSSSDEGDPEDGSEEEDVTEEEALAMFESSLDTD